MSLWWVEPRGSGAAERLDSDHERPGWVLGTVAGVVRRPGAGSRWQHLNN